MRSQVLIPIDKGYDFTISTIVRMDDKTTFPVKSCRL